MHRGMHDLGRSVVAVMKKKVTSEDPGSSFSYIYLADLCTHSLLLIPACRQMPFLLRSFADTLVFVYVDNGKSFCGRGVASIWASIQSRLPQ
jgi:hypothetical protein